MFVFKNRTASFDVDPQNGFTNICPDELPVPCGELIGKELNNNASFASIRVLSKDSHPFNAKWIATENNPMFSPVYSDSLNMDIHWKSHCVIGTKGFELIPDLPPVSDYDFIVYKGVERDIHPYGACYHDLNDTISTGVIEFLKINNIDTVIVGGLATDYCVATTAKQLKKAGFSVIVNLSSCKGIAIDTTEKAINELTLYSIDVVQNLNNYKIL